MDSIPVYENHEILYIDPATNTIKYTYTRQMDTWNCITRADDKSKTISVNAKHLLGFLFDKLQKDDCIIINHDWISKVTGCKRRQNINLIKQLEDIFTFTYRTQITVMDQNKKKRVLRYIYIKNT